MIIILFSILVVIFIFGYLHIAILLKIEKLLEEILEDLYSIDAGIHK